MNSSKLETLLRIKSKCYEVKSIPKRSVGHRKIYIPQGFLKLIQYRILKNFLNKECEDYLYAFETGRSVVDKAKKHTDKDYVVSIDIKDFFPSVTVKQIKGVFEHLGYDNVMSEICAELCSYKFFLPQGAVTSPKISNFVVSTTFGPELKSWADNQGLVLTVYADDVTFSFNVPSTVENHEAYVDGLVKTAKAIIEKHGFRIHLKGKLKVMPKAFRQEVCGMVVNQQVSMKREQRRLLRAMVHRAVVKGQPAFTEGRELRFSQLMGKIAWFHNFSPYHAEQMKKALSMAKKEAVEKVEKKIEVETPSVEATSAVDVPLEVPRPWQVSFSEGIAITTSGGAAALHNLPPALVTTGGV